MIETVKETGWFPIFKTGSITSMEGITKSYSEADIDKIIEMNKDRAEDVAVVCGHPDVAAPRWGSALAFRKRIIGGVAHLETKLQNVVKSFAEMVTAGMYNKVSIQLLSDSKINHIGFLGAAPPAVPGMPTVSFASHTGDTCVLSFSAQDDMFTHKSILRQLIRWISNIRDNIVETQSVDAANKIASSDDIGWATADAERLGMVPDPAVAESFSQKNDNTNQQTHGGVMSDELKKLQDQITTLTGQVKSFTQKNESLTTEVTALKTERDTLKKKVADDAAATQQASFASFCDEMCSAGKMAPKERESVTAVMTSLANSQELSFADGKKKSAVEAFQETIRSRPADETLVQSFAKKDTANSRATATVQVETLVQEEMKSDSTLSYAAALQSVANAKPELMKEYELEMRR